MVGANACELGVESRHGAENCALKNIAPFNRTPLRTSENASIFPRTPGKVSWRPCKAFQSRRTGGQELQPRGHGQPVRGPGESLLLFGGSPGKDFLRTRAPSR